MLMRMSSRSRKNDFLSGETIMMLRMLLVLVAVLGLTLGGCEKKEPTVGDVVDQAKEDAEKTADDAQPAAEEAAADAEKAAEHPKE
jgi:hypothetical protein